ncbi:TfuA-like protein [Rhizobium sp. C4]|uniref:TfuA-like protein n=1 Tax=Rhizobium sp. C4 TaxID=1349800 RepID=UPI001E52D394|nr:TfuA-like protein [Rhizobium sp. C4]MCD2173641.1 antibiotic resistance protein [Rhizobium sp. C4]
MKVVFAGPSLPDAFELVAEDTRIMPPATQGDMMKALQGGAKAIGLIDGQFEFVAPVWHKEILYALSQGVPVLGASSMGALRAVECAAFGMIGIGRIYEDYMTGRRWDDGDVALLHAPRELQYAPLTIPLVNVDATLQRARSLELLTPEDSERMFTSARRLFFKDRTWRRIAEIAGISFAGFEAILAEAWVDEKRQDALELLEALKRLDPTPNSREKPGWIFNSTPLWRNLYNTDL